MPIDDWLTQTIVFVVDADKPGSEPLATGFVVRVTEDVLHHDDLVGVHFHYVITAAHCVRGQTNVAIRAPVSESEFADVAIPISEWTIHVTEDVAIARIPGYWTAPAIRAETFADVAWELSERGPALGDRVYFLGLLADIPEMARRNVPMVRSGTLGARYVPRIPVRWAPDLVVHVTAHLIDCRSYQGFSGSPCLLQFDHGLRDRASGALSGIASTSALLGVVVAHFASEEHPNLHSGVGVVVPVEKIREILESDDEAAWRRTEAQHAAEQAIAGNVLQPPTYSGLIPPNRAWSRPDAEDGDGVDTASEQSK